jgi:glycosyltransferase involved in cell wall biosynthesis
VAPSLSVVLPMYNEEQYIRRSVHAARVILSEIAPDHEIIVVDDASTDRTGAIADELAAADPHVVVLHNPRNRTLGGTLRTGFAAACKDYVLYTDADLPFDIQEVGRALRLLEYQEADLLAAYRFNRTSEGPLRTLYSAVYNLMVRVLFGLRVHDVNFSFKLIRRSLLQKLDLKSEGSLIDVELLLRAQHAGGRVIQIGVDYFPRSRGVSTLSSPGVILKILHEMWLYRRELRRRS